MNFLGMQLQFRVNLEKINFARRVVQYFVKAWQYAGSM